MTTEVAPEFAIVKATREVVKRGPKPRVNPKVKGEKRRSNSKYSRLVAYMKKLEVDDYIILAKSIPTISAKSKLANTKHHIYGHIGNKLGDRAYDYKAVPATEPGREGYDIIVKRIM